jgi:hypothetical protein
VVSADLAGGTHFGMVSRSLDAAKIQQQAEGK